MYCQRKLCKTNNHQNIKNDSWKGAFLPYPHFAVLTEIIWQRQISKGDENDTSHPRDTRSSISGENFDAMKCPTGRAYSSFISAFYDPNYTVLIEFFLNHHLTRSLRMAQDTIDWGTQSWGTQSFIPKALINGKSSK